ncbi:hypothetical protein UPYG_G00045770 [Umbra pygmaea]|uniref:Interleukin n=1 Tax=Umbra pygmaea TaxID=75934 RepID=A0ABD0Y6E9_UMBPY
MTGFLTVLFLLYVYSRERKKKKSVQRTGVLWGFQHFKHPNTKAWDCFIILSCLVVSTCVPMANTAETHDPHSLGVIQNLLTSLTSTIEKSDASLYAPTNDDIKDYCIFTFMYCYLLELEMVLNEELYEHERTRNEIYHKRKELERQVLPYNTTKCSPCEAQTVANSTVFLSNFKNLLMRASSL